MSRCNYTYTPSSRLPAGRIRGRQSNRREKAEGEAYAEAEAEARTKTQARVKAATRTTFLIKIGTSSIHILRRNIRYWHKRHRGWRARARVCNGRT